MSSAPDGEMAAYLRRAADGTVTKEDFYEYFGAWKLQTHSPLFELIFKEIEHFWASNSRWWGAPRNIKALNLERLRVLARALEEGWEHERAQEEVDWY